MKHIINTLLSLLLITLAFTFLQAQSTSGKLLESLTMESKILKKGVEYCIYLPQYRWQRSKERKQQTYPDV